MQRIAGARSAELLAEFSRTCRIPTYTGTDFTSPISPDITSKSPVDVPMLRSLRRRSTELPMAEVENGQNGVLDFGEWLNFSMESFAGWGGAMSQSNPMNL